MNEQMPGIRFTSEIREDFSDEWGLPTLDTVMKMEEKGEVVGRMRRLQYRFYRKPMATDLVTDYHSAHSLNSKIATLTQDVYRIMSNCSPETTLEEKSAHLEEFTRRLRLSHYPPSISAKIISNGIVTYKRALEREARKERNLHRLGEEGLVERKLRKVSLKENWFRKKGSNPTPTMEPQKAQGFGGKRRQPVQNIEVTRKKTVRLSAPVFIPATKNSYLLQKIRLRRIGWVTLLGGSSN